MARWLSAFAIQQLCALVFVANLLSVTAALADARNDVRSDISETERFIQKSTARKESLDVRAGAMAAQIDDLRIRAARAAQRIQVEETTLSIIDRRLALLNHENRANRRRLKHLQAGLTQSLTALARLQRHPAAAMLAVPGTILDADRGGRLLAAAVPVLQKDAAKLGEFLRSAHTVRQQLQIEQRRRTTAMAALSARRTELYSLLKERTTSEHRLRQAGEVEGRRLAMFASRAKDLQGLMQRLEQTVREDRDNIKLKAAKLAADKSAARWPGRISPQENSPKQKLALAPQILPFSKLRGRLRLPARGTPMGQFGESTGLGPRSQGVTLRTRQGAQVVAPYDGRVVFAGPFRNYGLILIISHGDGYHTLLAGLSKLQTVVGQDLLTGEPMGMMGRDNKRSLYIELRRKGTAINPTPWWSGSRERVSG